MAKKGDYVTAKLVGKKEVRQGVYVKDRIGTIIVQGQLGTYTCEKKGATTVPDSNLDGNTLAFVRRVRRERGL